MQSSNFTRCYSSYTILFFLGTKTTEVQESSDFLNLFNVNLIYKIPHSTQGKVERRFYINYRESLEISVETSSKLVMEHCHVGIKYSCSIVRQNISIQIILLNLDKFFINFLFLWNTKYQIVKIYNISIYLYFILFYYFE